jgi:hypothetical protein
MSIAPAPTKPPEKYLLQKLGDVQNALTHLQALPINRQPNHQNKLPIKTAW